MLNTTAGLVDHRHSYHLYTLVAEVSQLLVTCEASCHTCHKYLTQHDRCPTCTSWHLPVAGEVFVGDHQGIPIRVELQHLPGQIQCNNTSRAAHPTKVVVQRARAHLKVIHDLCAQAGGGVEQGAVGDHNANLLGLHSCMQQRWQLLLVCCAIAASSLPHLHVVCCWVRHPLGDDPLLLPLYSVTLHLAVAVLHAST